MPQRPFPTLFISHGGGPCFSYTPQPPFPPHAWDHLAAYLRGLSATLGRRPKAVLVISAHWEENIPTVTTNPHPSLIYDYSGFPEETYHLTYSAPGSPALAARVQQLLTEANILNAANPTRGFDHGVFVPFQLIYPEADLPIVQLSLHASLNPALHFAIGQALTPLREEDILIVGSGMSYHNLREFFSPAASEQPHPSQAFNAWLTDAVTTPNAKEREQKLLAWEQAPGARRAHPRAEHLLPLFVAAGAASTVPGRPTYADTVLGKAVSGFQFG
jgi:aromatic ring-opening dioxygenase catalytic subunit (LigB family)